MAAQIAGPPFSAIIPETVPESQRGLCVTIQGWLCQIFVLSQNGLGYLVGEGCPSPPPLPLHSLDASEIKVENDSGTVTVAQCGRSAPR